MNNTNYTEEQLSQAYEELPENIKELLMDENFGFLMQSIGEKNGATPMQSLDVEYEVVRVLLGLHEPEDLARNIRDNLGITGEIAWGIARDVKTDIFGEGALQEEKEQSGKVAKKDINISTTMAPIPPTPAEKIEHIFEKKLKEAQKSVVSVPIYKGGQDPYREKTE